MWGPTPHVPGAPACQGTICVMGRRHESKRHGRFRRKAIFAGSVVLLEAAALRIRSGRLGGNVVVMLFTTASAATPAASRWSR